MRKQTDAEKHVEKHTKAAHADHERFSKASRASELKMDKAPRYGTNLTQYPPSNYSSDNQGSSKENQGMSENN